MYQYIERPHWRLPAQTLQSLEQRLFVFFRYILHAQLTHNIQENGKKNPAVTCGSRRPIGLRNVQSMQVSSQQWVDTWQMGSWYATHSHEVSNTTTTYFQPPPPPQYNNNLLSTPPPPRFKAKVGHKGVGIHPKI